MTNSYRGNSTAVESINKEPEKSLSQKWDELPQGTKSGVYVGAAAVGAISFLALAFYYIKQRRRGAREAAMEAHEAERERVEMNRFRKSRGNFDDLAFDGADAAAAGKGPSVNVGYAIPDSPPASAAGPPEKAWDPTGSNTAPLLGRH